MSIAHTFASLQDQSHEQPVRRTGLAFICLLFAALSCALMLASNASAAAGSSSPLSALDGHALAKTLGSSDDDLVAPADDDDPAIAGGDDSSGGVDSTADGGSVGVDTGNPVCGAGGTGGTGAAGGSTGAPAGSHTRAAARAARGGSPTGGGSPTAAGTPTGGSKNNNCTPPAPAIEVQKDVAEAVAAPGDVLHYSVVVKNTGNVKMLVTPSDASCTGFDATPFKLDPGDSKSLACTYAVTTASGASHKNEACAKGVPKVGAEVEDCDDAETKINQPNPPNPPGPTAEGAVLGATAQGGTPAGQLVLGDKVVAGTARLLGPTGCQSRAFNARVRGTKIASVRFVLDGKTLKRVSKPNRAGLFAVRINPSKLRIGVHRLVATVTFQRGSATRPRTMRLSFQRCARALQSPRFTG
jgi:hypothetical protein